jgi:ribonuclease P protein component
VAEAAPLVARGYALRLRAVHLGPRYWLGACGYAPDCVLVALGSSTWLGACDYVPASACGVSTCVARSCASLRTMRTIASTTTRALRTATHPTAHPRLWYSRLWRPRQKDNARLTCDRAAPARLTLPAQRRLRRKSDFDAAYAGGRRFGNGFFGVTAFSNDKGWPRLGLAVSVRTAGGGVQRNRIRRIIRESFRLHQHQLPGVDLIVSARNRVKDAPRSELHASLVELWKKVKEQCATLPRS